MRSVRIGADLEERLERAARAEGVRVSEFIREAVRDRCTHILGNTLREELTDVIGAVERKEGAALIRLAEESGTAFAELLRKRASAEDPERLPRIHGAPRP